ncbi:hypothetical protein K435DRAFT_873317 [Dendrothele bispora CBS 962.96]|uniref:Uncharacterized protein n=1 Tax=Dendrothele bispora (strain CBS 962.96) TaxID=1314807 RepID=A0A4S8KZW0_DENBC|nr:hypothetical protein K435DRAFT_873317 [Dendrothele bispora CBS 962.96]
MASGMGMDQDNSSSNTNSTNNDSGADNSSSSKSNSTDNAASSDSSQADSNPGNFGGCFEILAGLNHTGHPLLQRVPALPERRALSSRTSSSRRHLTTRRAAAKHADTGADPAADTKDNEKAGSVGDIVAALDFNIAGPVSVVNDATKALDIPTKTDKPKSNKT